VDSRLNPSMNVDDGNPAVAGKIAKPEPVEKVRTVRYVLPASAIQAPIGGHQIIDAVQRSIGSFQSIVADVKDILRGVEADVRAVETIQLVEEPEKRTLTIQRKYRIIKDR
jgi:hypothetical protein